MRRSPKCAEFLLESKLANILVHVEKAHRHRNREREERGEKGAALWPRVRRGDWESKGQLELWAAWSINRLHVKYRALVFLRCTHQADRSDCSMPLDLIIASRALESVAQRDRIRLTHTHPVCTRGRKEGRRVNRAKCELLSRVHSPNASHPPSAVKSSHWR